jgi:hypothetical protein
VSWSSVADWAPVLVGVWVDFELLDLPARRRRWSLKVHARDSTVVRDGSLETRSGRQVSADLWDAWETGAILPFRDVDYDAVPVERLVRLTGINEEIPKPADAAQWGESIVDLTLVEV